MVAEQDEEVNNSKVGGQGTPGRGNMSAEAGTGSMLAWCVEQGGAEAGQRHCLGVKRLRGSGRGPGQEPVGGSEVWTEG